MKTVNKKKISEKSKKKLWKKPVIKEEKSLLETKSGEYSGSDAEGDGDFIGAS